MQSLEPVLPQVWGEVDLSSEISCGYSFEIPVLEVQLGRLHQIVNLVAKKEAASNTYKSDKYTNLLIISNRMMEITAVVNVYPGIKITTLFASTLHVFRYETIICELTLLLSFAYLVKLFSKGAFNKTIGACLYSWIFLGSTTVVLFKEPFVSRRHQPIVVNL